MTSSAFLTDKYELTMLDAAMAANKHEHKTVFELFARRLPQGRRYGVVSGVNRFVELVKEFTFTQAHINSLRREGVFSDELLQFLQDFHFNGTITGLREGDVYFPYTPILTIEGTFAECVLLETVALSVLNHDSAVASAASRMVNAANGIPIIEMGSRRTSEQSAVFAARAAYIAGFTATSNLEAGLRYGVPTTGTSAHAFTLLFGNEKDAFKAQVERLGVGTTLLVDTYDIERGIRNAIEVAGKDLGGIRIDSGDLHEETRNARKLLDSLGAINTKIVLSSDIDEYTIQEMIDQETPVDVVGAGTRVVTGSGSPTSGMVYKLVSRQAEEGETGDRDGMVPVVKKASGKGSVGGRKHILRTYDKNGTMVSENYIVGPARPEMCQVPEGGSVRCPQRVFVRDGDFMKVETASQARDYHRKVIESLPAEALLVTAGEPTFMAEEIHNKSGEKK